MSMSEAESSSGPSTTPDILQGCGFVANLSRAILNRANLEEAGLSGADLRAAQLRGANLRGAILRGAILGDADLSRADLTKANLRWANLNNANLTGADLTEVDLTDAEVSAQTLSKAKSVSKVDRPDTSHFESAPAVVVPTQSGPLPNPRTPSYQRPASGRTNALSSPAAEEKPFTKSDKP